MKTEQENGITRKTLLALMKLLVKDCKTWYFC